MKILTTRRVFYNGKIIPIGKEIEINSNIVPSWAVEIKEKSGDKFFEPIQTKLNIENSNSIKSLSDITSSKEDISNNISQTNEELRKELEELITKGVEQGVLLENVEKKSPIEQILELKEKLNEV